jgi:N-acetylmuramoyl-L-alanine amidase
MTAHKLSAGRAWIDYTIFVCLFLLLATGLLFLIYHLGRFGTQVNSEVDTTSPPLIRTIILDAGHGGEDGGAIGQVNGREIYEKDINLSVTLMLRDLLEAEGFNVILTRETDTLLYDRNTEYKGRKKALDLAARLAIGQNTPDAMFVSIHMNAFPQKQYHGLQVYYSTNHPLSSTIAQSIQSETVRRLQPNNTRAIKGADSNIYLLHHMKCPAVLVECGFLSNEEECRLLCDKEYQEQLAFVLFCSIRQSMSPSNTAP